MSTSKNPNNIVTCLVEGRYDALVVNAQPGKHPKQKHTTVRIDFEIVGPTHVGDHISKWYNLTSKPAADFLKREFASMDIPVSNEADLPAACEAIVNKVVSLEIIDDPETGYQKKFILCLSDATIPTKATSDIWSS